MLKIKIIYEDPNFVVIEKPSGLLSVPGRGADMQNSVVSQLKGLYSNCMEQPSVHRLDMDTSGLQVLAFNKECHRKLSIQFQNREVNKAYIALLDGVVDGGEGTIELAFRLDPDNRPYQVYDEKHGKVGITHWKKIMDIDGRTLMSFVPITGRTHQLRLHASHHKGLGVPIQGDRLYGAGTAPGQLKLHACYLSFAHPKTGDILLFKSAPKFSSTWLG